MKIKIEKKPRLAKKLSIYIRNDWSSELDDAGDDLGNVDWIIDHYSIS